MLVEISAKLDRIEAKVDRILQALADDRRAELRGCIKQVEEGLLASHAVNRDGLLRATAANLNMAIEKEIKAFERALSSIPNPPEKFIRGFFWDTSAQTSEALGECERSMIAIIEGIRALTQLYTALDEQNLAWSTAAQRFRDLESLDLDSARIKARMIRPSDNGPWPELFWVRAIETISQCRQRASIFAKHAETGADSGGPNLAIELTSDEMGVFAESTATP